MFIIRFKKYDNFFPFDVILVPQNSKSFLRFVKYQIKADFIAKE
jgi:hypothetical protein